jgi:peptide/nickel transport system permease protein
VERERLSDILLLSVSVIWGVNLVAVKYLLNDLSPVNLILVRFITGSLLLEMYFGIPGMGNLMLNTINNHDYPVIRTLVYVYSLLYIAGSVLTDISYTLVDPRVAFK